MTFPFPIPPGKRLYHPCCGDDLSAPLLSYAELIDVFIFVDASRLPRWERHRNPRPETLPGHPGYQCIASEVSGDPEARPQRRYVKATDNHEDTLDSLTLEGSSCVLQETYQSKTGRSITVIRKSGCGLLSLEDLDGLDVFYYTGDGAGEGGSNLPLMRSPEQFWLPKMRTGGVVATDGSNDTSGQFGKWSRWSLQDLNSVIGKTFSSWGRQFTCQRDLGMKNGPVLEWGIEALNPPPLP